MTRWYIKGGDSGVISSGTADFDFVPASTIRPGDTFIARVATRDARTPAPVTSGDWTFITSSPDTSNSTSGSDAAISQDFVWYTTFDDTKDLTWSRGGSAVQLRGAFAVAPAMGYEIELVASSSGTNATGATTSTLTSLTTTEDDELIVMFASSGRNTSWTNWDAATDPTTASGSGGSSQIGLFDPTTAWQRHQSNGSTSGSDISGSIGVAVKSSAGSTGNITVTNGVTIRPAWVATRWRQVQATTLKVVQTGGGGVYPGTGDTNAATLPFTPTSGNTLFAFVAIDKDATSDVTATGWTREMQERSGSAVSAALFRKVSDGTETEIEVTYTSSASSGFSLFVVEIEGEVEIDVSATSTTYLSTASKTSGTATTANTTAAGGLAIGFWANDSYASCDSGTLETWSDGFIAAPGPKTRQYWGASDVGSPAVAVGWKEIESSGTAVSTSYTYTGDTDDENLLFLVVLKEVVSGSVASSSGSASVSGIGASYAGGVGNVSGVAAVSGVGAAQAASAGSSSGVAATTGAGAASASAVGTSAGSATVSGVGSQSAEADATGTAAGSSSSSAQARADVRSAGSSSGQATTSGVGAARASAQATSAGVATATGAAAARAGAAGTSAGASSVTGLAAAAASAVGTSAASTTVAVVAASSVAAVGTSTAAAAVDGDSAANADAAGTSAGVATVSGVTPEVAPQNTVAPVVTGVGYVGQTLTTTDGTWTGSPTGYTYQWQRNTGSWADISGETSSTYVVALEDEGVPVRCVVTATNDDGSTDAASNVIEQWVPTDYTEGSIALWFDAFSPDTVTESSGAVSAWASRVGSKSAAQADGTRQPIYSATAHNSLPGITADGSNDRLTVANPAGLPSGTTAGAIIVAAYMGDKVASAISLTGYGAYTGNYYPRSLTTASGFWRAKTTEPGFVDRSTASFTPNQYETQNIGVAYFNSAGMEFALNGAGPNTYSVSINTQQETNGLHIFAREAFADWYFKGTGKEFIYTSGTLSTENRQYFEGYLAHRWGITDRLDSGHPYKTNAPTPDYGSSVASSDAAASVSGVGGAQASAIGSSDSAASTSGAAAAYASSSGTASGGSTTQMLTASGSVASSSGQASVSGVAAASASTAASAAGSSTVTGLAAASVSAVGSSDSEATVAGSLAAEARSTASASGSATVDAQSSIEESADSVGSSTGAATVLGSGGALASAQGSVQGVATVSGVARASLSSIAVATGGATVEGVAAVYADAVAASVAASVVDGKARASGLVVPSPLYWVASA
jgi:hypothetical protein